MKNIALFFFAFLISITGCFGEGISVSKTNGTAIGITLVGTTTNVGTIKGGSINSNLGGSTNYPAVTSIYFTNKTAGTVILTTNLGLIYEWIGTNGLGGGGGGSQTLAQVLATGNLTGGNDIAATDGSAVTFTLHGDGSGNYTLVSSTGGILSSRADGTTFVQNQNNHSGDGGKLAIYNDNSMEFRHATDRNLRFDGDSNGMTLRAKDDSNNALPITIVASPVIFDDSSGFTLRVTADGSGNYAVTLFSGGTSFGNAIGINSDGSIGFSDSSSSSVFLDGATGVQARGGNDSQFGIIAGANFYISNNGNTGAKGDVLTANGATSDTAWQALFKTTSNTTSSVTFNTNGLAETVYDNSASTIASLTINLPSSTVAGQICRYVTKATTTVVTVNGTVSIGAAITTLAANSSVAWQAVSTSGTFIRIQ